MDQDLEIKTNIIQKSQADPISLAVSLMSEMPDLIRCNKQLYQYNGKCYDLITTDDIYQYYHSFVTKYGIVKAWKIRSDVLAAINSTRKIETIKRFNTYENLMCINNGVLDIYTKELKPHDKSYFFDSYIAVDYKPEDKDCPHFYHYLNDTFRGDQETIQNMIMLGGYLLDTSCKANKMFLFEGSGGSGKSTIINIFLMFFHQTNDNTNQVTSIPLEELASGSFDKEDLINSRLNVAAETKRGYVDAEEIKKMITGDLIKVSRKFERSITFVPKFKIVVACNGLPKFTDMSDAMFRRLVIISFKNKYRTKEEIEAFHFRAEMGYKVIDFSLMDKIAKEKSAIFNLFLDGLKVLKENNYQFVLGKDLIRSLHEFSIDTDSCREFLEECYEVDDRSFVDIKELFTHYREWYKQNVQEYGVMKFRSNELGKRIREHFGIESVSKYKLVGNRRLHFRGYNLKEKGLIDGYEGSTSNIDELNQISWTDK